MADAVRRVAFEPDRRSGEVVLWTDTAVSLQRLGLGLGLATLIGLVLGIAIGILPFVSATLASLIAVICMIPPMPILPVLFIVFGLGELSKVVLILIGVAPRRHASGAEKTAGVLHVYYSTVPGPYTPEGGGMGWLANRNFEREVPTEGRNVTPPSSPGRPSTRRAWRGRSSWRGARTRAAPRPRSPICLTMPSAAPPAGRGRTRR
jgi:hypothetical protein